MNIPRIMAISRIDSPLRLTVAYVLFGLVWIVGSDGLVAWRRNEGIEVWAVDSAKGLLFVGVTAVLLHTLSRRMVERNRATEEALYESRLRWQFALEGAGDGLWDWNIETNRVFLSPQWKGMLGYADHEIVDSVPEWESRVHPDDLAMAWGRIGQILNEGASLYLCEHRLRTKEGTYKWILARGKVVSRAPDGRPLRMIGTHTDVTERKLAEARMAETLAFSEAVLRSTPVGILTLRSDGSLVTANEAAHRMVGAQPGQLPGQNFRALKAWESSGLRLAVEQALREGGEVQCMTELRTDSGGQLWLEAQVVSFAFHGETRFMVLLSDESKSQRALANLHVLQAGLEAIPNGVVITGRDGMIKWVNPGFTTLTGYSREEAIGLNPRVLKSNRQGPEFYAAMWSTIARGQVWQGELQNQRKDGSIYSEYMTIAPVDDPQGAITHFVAIKQDLTQMKELEQQLARVQRLESIGLLASGLAHDLNNIFAPILLSLELLRLKYPASDGRKMLEMVEAAGQRGAGIVRQVLTFARGMDGERTEVHPKYLVKELAQMLGETVPRNIRIEVRVAADLPAVKADATQLHQVLLNLAVNARDAMPTGGSLTLGAERLLVDEARAARNPPLKAGPCVALTVTDTGSGIPPEVLDRMFEPFFTTKPRGKGTGLGLSTVYGIVRSHGGAVEVNSEMGVGTEFRVLLPALNPTEVRSGTRPPLPESLKGAGRIILVVDDEEAIRVITQETLVAHGFKVELAADGLDARDKFLRDPARYAALITDLMMPRMGGLDLVRAIRPVAPALPVMISSGLSGEGDSHAEPEGLTELGVHMLIRKPYGEHELLKALAGTLESRNPSPNLMEKKV
jgi:two-component system cell cycle sensor histidine kinase/response regulator CckA